jgi:hypothetical protein
MVSPMGKKEIGLYTLQLEKKKTEQTNPAAVKGLTRHLNYSANSEKKSSSCEYKNKLPFAINSEPATRFELISSIIRHPWWATKAKEWSTHSSSHKNILNGNLINFYRALPAGLQSCRYPTNNNMPEVMNYAASLTGAASPTSTMAAAAHFYQQQVGIQGPLCQCCGSGSESGSTGST